MNETRTQFDHADCGDELTELAVLHLDGRLDPARCDRLNQLLSSDSRNRDLFVAVCTHASLLASGLGVDGEQESEASDPQLVISPVPSTHYQLPATFVGGPVFSYMVATVVLCLMLLGAWAYKISHVNDSHIADNSRRSTISSPLGQEELSFVGKISGMTDCRWSNPDTQTVVGASVPLDREYALASGLLEISYQSGAKVILEGPCTYKVDSDAGGYLAVGKLTARVENKGSGFRDRGSENSPLSSLPSPLFAVRTPTALVTDLGTEFGVEVAENGDTTSYVFQGAIKVQGLAASSIEKVLHENESVRVSRVRETHHESTVETVRFTHPAILPEFARQMPAMQMANGSMSVMDSADFTWKYEMDVDPAAQDLDANPGPDWKLLRGIVQVNGDGTATLAAAGESMGSLVSGGPGDPEHATGHVWNNITPDTGYTVELRVKVVGTVPWYGHNLGLYLTANDSTDEKSSMVVITNESTLWDRISRYLVDNNRNDDDFHVFRIAQEPNSGQYQVWRDGVLVRLSEGFQPTGWNRVHFGDMGTGSGPNVVDYVRIIAGAHAPPKRIPAAPSPDGVEKTKEKPPMEH